MASKPKKLKSGSWNVRVYEYTSEDGVKHYKSITAPTKAEVMRMVSEFEKEKATRNIPKTEFTVGQAVDRYIELSEVLSPTTLISYRNMRKYGFQSLMDKKVKNLTDEDMQLAINEESRRKTKREEKQLSAKTVKNEWTLLSSAIKTVCGLTYNVKLPKYQRHIKEYPEPETVIKAIVGSVIELPCMLAIWLTFSMSEIRGLMCSSVKDGFITIDQVLIEMNGEQILKSNAKVDTRLRKHEIPPYIMSLIENTEQYRNYTENGVDSPLVPMTRASLYGKWQTLCKQNGFEISFHDLRHMAASIMLMLDIPTRYSMERGGWKTDSTMKRHYQHTFSKERQVADAKVDDYMQGVIKKV